MLWPVSKQSVIREIFRMATLYLFVNELYNANITVRYKNFSTTAVNGGVLRGSLLHSFLEYGNFLNINILQGKCSDMSKVWWDILIRTLLQIY